jgi:hypothetical protein
VTQNSGATWRSRSSRPISCQIRTVARGWSAKRGCSLNHQHIGAIYGLEDTDNVLALVLELIEGETLADRIARGPVSVKEAIAIARQIADALNAAHDRGIVHRDLKPANRQTLQRLSAWQTHRRSLRAPNET